MCVCALLLLLIFLVPLGTHLRFSSEHDLIAPLVGERTSMIKHTHHRLASSDMKEQQQQQRQPQQQRNQIHFIHLICE